MKKLPVYLEHVLRDYGIRKKFDQISQFCLAGGDPCAEPSGPRD
jgi:hypothetical protein